MLETYQHQNMVAIISKDQMFIDICWFNPQKPSGKVINLSGSFVKKNLIF